VFAILTLGRQRQEDHEFETSLDSKQNKKPNATQPYLSDLKKKKKPIKAQTDFLLHGKIIN
jgi:hypothetical protein